ncbi:MAG: PAS domain-containing protein [Deltaproteobacteria bacterium]|nr:PAS domain-containing protein [Deltaproteobacteria bacterium]
MTQKLIDRPSKEQMEAILDALPIEFIFVDAEDRLQYYNKGEKRTMKPPVETLGKDIRTCHRPESVGPTEVMLNAFKNGEKDEDAFWVDGLGIKLLNRFLAFRDKKGTYLGCVEYLLDFSALERLAEENKDAHRFHADQQRPTKLEEIH